MLLDAGGARNGAPARQQETAALRLRFKPRPPGGSTMTTVAAVTRGAALSERGDMRHVVARLERLPYCSWHLKMRLIICTAWFFDAFDSIAIAYVLPPLIGLWHLTPPQIGSLIGVGFAGQLVGAHRLRLDRRALGPAPLDAGDVADLLARRARLRRRPRATTTVVAALRPRHRARRRNSADGRLRQRVCQGQGTRPLLAQHPGAVLGRPAWSVALVGV